MSYEVEKPGDGNSDSLYCLTVEKDHEVEKATRYAMSDKWWISSGQMRTFVAK